MVERSGRLEDGIQIVSCQELSLWRISYRLHGKHQLKRTGSPDAFFEDQSPTHAAMYCSLYPSLVRHPRYEK